MEKVEARNKHFKVIGEKVVFGAVRSLKAYGVHSVQNLNAGTPEDEDTNRMGTYNSSVVPCLGASIITVFFCP